MKTLILCFSLTLTLPVLAGAHPAKAPSKERSVAGKKSLKEGQSYLDALRTRMRGMSNKTRI